MRRLWIALAVMTFVVFAATGCAYLCRDRCEQCGSTRYGARCGHCGHERGSESHHGAAQLRVRQDAVDARRDVE